MQKDFHESIPPVQPNAVNSSQIPTLIRAATIADGTGFVRSPGAVLLRRNQIVASGHPSEVGEVSGARVVDLPQHVVLPGLVNAHAHLDLTHVGRRPHRGNFIQWIHEIRSARAADSRAVHLSVERGILLSRAGGTALVGDIAGGGNSIPLDCLRDAGLGGVSYQEVFGVGLRQGDAIQRLRERLNGLNRLHSGVALGIEPHAPYSCGTEVYEACAALGIPMATHLAETREELEFIDQATGPFADLLKSLGLWDDSIRPQYCHPLQHLSAPLARPGNLLAHVNYLSDRDLETLATWKASVVFCPRAHQYFGHHAVSPHPFLRMLAAGVLVALGTDSIVCLDRDDRISVLDDARLLHRRDGVALATLLQMITNNGAKALGFVSQVVSLQPGSTAGLLAIETGDSADRLKAAFAGDSPPNWIAGPFPAQDSWFIGWPV